MLRPEQISWLADGSFTNDLRTQADLILWLHRFPCTLHGAYVLQAEGRDQGNCTGGSVGQE